MADSDKTSNTIAKETVAELASRLAEPSWLVDNRLSAWESYYKTPMPGKRDEGWKRTEIGTLDLGGLRTASLPAVSQSKEAGKLPDWLADAMSHFKDYAGFLYQSTSEAGFYTLDEELAARGVILCDIGTAVLKHADLVKPYLCGSTDTEEDGKFALLAKALFNCGLFLYVPRGVEISRPFIYAVDLDARRNEAVLPRTIVVAEDMSSLTLAYIIGSRRHENESPKSSQSLISQYIETHVKPGARLRYLEVQEQGKDIFLVNRSNCLVDRDGKYESLTLALGACQTKSDMATVLRAPGAASEVLGVVLGADDEKFSFNTIQEHAASDTKSDINFRVALKDKSSSVYQGIVRVAKVAQRTDAFQQNKNLLLDGTATADSIPKLEILADDVKCSHGATVGPVDREQIFYLMSRGVTRKVAEQLVVLGFFRQTLERFSFKDGLSWLSEAVSRKIHGGKAADGADEFFLESN